MGRKKKTYTLEFKKKCIAELLGGMDFSRGCADNGVAPSMLSDWKQQVLEGMGSSKKSREEEKIIENLRKELERAQRLLGKKEMENELLKIIPAALNTVDLCRKNIRPSFLDWDCYNLHEIFGIELLSMG